jgi:hypothetical protein
MDLWYYDELAKQDAPIRLTVSVSDATHLHRTPNVHPSTWPSILRRVLVELSPAHSPRL